MAIIDRSGRLDGPQPDLVVVPTVAPETVLAEAGANAIVGIRFPAHSDGRGFTLARRLRRLGFTGRLRAVGPVVPDQFANLLACGFDEVEIPDSQLERQPITQWGAALGASVHVYQACHTDKISILAARRSRHVTRA